ncbi:MAG TPA: YlaI family protein [Lentibacillus sp.]|uniref:YlaI family protein n=1 Tax=Lentibacillus sp. TaxID=1925746 RepID=UPI002B4AF6B1|nr:YlaI family protein [Lentibacillus sp.]HLR62252.1 YlaI family protein [Lentibacillus sp.]
MKVQCVLCDEVNELEDDSLQAKRLRNRRIYMYLCSGCYDRIDNKTRERHATGSFKLYDAKKKKKDLI